MESIVIIQLKDIMYGCDNDFYIVKKDKDFEKKYKKLVDLCGSIECFNKIKTFIEKNFEVINFEIRHLEM